MTGITLDLYALNDEHAVRIGAALANKVGPFRAFPGLGLERHFFLGEGMDENYHMAPEQLGKRTIGHFGGTAEGMKTVRPAAST
jgi:hypothetical protein